METLIGESPANVGATLQQTRDALKFADAIVTALVKKTPTPWDDVAWKFGGETLTGEQAAMMIHSKLVTVGLGR